MRKILIFITIGFLFLACISSAEAGQEALPEKVSVNDHANRAYKTSDDKFLEVSAKVPGFGGMFIDGDVMKVYLVNPAQRHEAEAGIASVFGRERIPQGGIQVLQGQYSFPQLKKWHGSMGTVFNIPGVIFTDVDESSNRLKVGVESPDSFGAVEQELIKQGIPRGAFVIEKAEPVVYAYTLQDSMRPIQGGIQIRYSNYLCTLGFNGVRLGTSGFVINSHCTDNQGGVESTQYYQPLDMTTDNFIGTEIADPEYTETGCYDGCICRWSDAAYAERAEGVPADTGLIARPDSVNSGSLNIAGNFQIISEGVSVVGDSLNKVGRTTGWTQGKVTATCVDTGVSGTNIVQLCQTHVRAGVGGGDSGSPVFKITDPEKYDIELLGILWGGSANGRSFVYSPMTNIENELGSIDTTYTIVDSTSPVISEVDAVSITESSATITWTTDEVSDSEVNYGKNTLLGTIEYDLAFVTTHSVTLTGLQSGTIYYYEVNSTDSSGNTTTDDNNSVYYTFTTTTSDTPSPGNEMHIADISMDLGFKYAGRTNVFTQALATVTVVNSSGIPVSGAQVTGTWSNLTSDSDIATTGTDGEVTVCSDRIKNLASGTFTFTVDDVKHSDFTYNATANVIISNSTSVN